MFSGADLGLVYRIANAPVRAFPFPHLYVPDIFPPELYAAIQANMPAPGLLAPIAQARGSQGYPERFILQLGGELPAGLSDAQRAFWAGFGRMLLGGRLAHAVLQKFGAEIERQLAGTPEFEISDEAMLVHDRTRFSLGPHTDSPKKACALLFYLPADASQLKYGTSLYVPREPGFTCRGDRHHGFEDFERAATMPFAPNSLFVFPKSDVSFHGVEPIREENVGRNLVLYDLRVRVPAAPAANPAPAPAGPAIRFRL